MSDVTISFEMAMRALAVAETMKERHLHDAVIHFPVLDAIDELTAHLRDALAAPTQAERAYLAVWDRLDEIVDTKLDAQSACAWCDGSGQNSTADTDIYPSPGYCGACVGTGMNVDSLIFRGEN